MTQPTDALRERLASLTYTVTLAPVIEHGVVIAYAQGSQAPLLSKEQIGAIVPVVRALIDEAVGATLDEIATKLTTYPNQVSPICVEIIRNWKPAQATLAERPTGTTTRNAVENNDPLDLPLAERDKRPWHIREACYFCNKEFKDGKPQCEHPEATKEVTDATSILMGVEFCDHFCCGMSANLCKAVRLAQALAERDRRVPAEGAEVS